MKTLIQALREAARQLGNPQVEYEWTQPTRCNCGILASCIVGRDIQVEDLALPDFTGIWSESAVRIYERCSSTRLPLPFVFSALRDAGVGRAEIRDIEYCSHPEVLRRMDVRFSERRNRQFVARYFTTWADLLEEQAPVIPTTTQDQVPAIEARDVLMVEAVELEVA